MKFASFALLLSVAQCSAFAPSSPQRKSSALNGVLSQTTGQSSLDPAVIARYNELPFPGDTILAEYVWVDADGNTRSKTRTLPASKVRSFQTKLSNIICYTCFFFNFVEIFCFQNQAEKVENLPKWNFDGSSTNQAPGDDSEVILRPCRIFKDPFRPRNDGVDNILVMCDTYTPAGEPLPTNSRAKGEYAKSI